MPSKALSTWPDAPLCFCEKESYLSWFTLEKVGFRYIRQTHFHLIMSLKIFHFPPSIQKTFMKSKRAYDEEIPQSHTADQPMAPLGRVT